MRLNKRQDLSIIQGITFVCVAFLLMLFDWQPRESISDYVYGTPVLFGLLLGISGATFFYNGYTDRKKWFDMIIGGSLIGVALTPHLDYTILHYFFSSIFFLGNIFNIVYFTTKHRILKGVIGVTCLMGLVGTFCGLYSLYWGEVIAIVGFGLNYIGEGLKITD